MLKIVQIPNPVLTTPTKPVENFDSWLKKLVIDMEEALIACVDPQGVGLAATQVGHGLSLFIMKPEPKQDTKVFINPTVVNLEWEKESAEKKPKKKKNTPLEGCLSIPRIWSPVKRASKVTIEYQDVNGKKHTDTFTGFEAIIVQHEVDHLNGTLFTMRAIEQNSTLYEEKDGELEPVKF